MPTDVEVTEDTAGNVDLSAASFSDADGDSLTVSLLASSGTLAASSGDVETSWNSESKTLTLTGTVANINAFLGTPSNVQYKGALNQNGNDAATITVKANDGTVNPELGTINIDITAVNDEPSFTIGTNQTVAQNASAQSIAGFITDINDGDPEVLQTVTFQVSNDYTDLFSTQPAIDSSGSLTYAPNPSKVGTATVTVSVSDDGGTADGGDDQSAGQRFTITIQDVAPTVTSVSVPINGTYIRGQNLDFTVNFSEVVTVDTTNGAPYFSIALDDELKQAQYLSGSDSSALVFRYTIAAGDVDLDGITVGSAIIANDGTIKDATDTDANLNLNSVASTGAVLVDGVKATVSGVPTDVKAVAGNGQATITFSVPADDGGTAITKYIVTSTPGDITAEGTTTSITVDGLTNGTEYTFKVKAINAAGIGADSTASNSVTPYRPSSSSGSSSSSTSTQSSTVVEVNGQKQDAGTANTQTSDGQTVTTIKVDDTKLNKVLESKDEKPTVTLPTSTSSDVVVGELNGQTVKNMEQKEATLEIKTETVSYTLPASQINIDAVFSEIGSQVELKDIKVNIKIAEPTTDTVKVVEDTAQKGNYQIVVKPVEFEITCTSGSKTVAVSKFNGYVERTVAIPDGVDPQKITTGIVLNADGSFRHVPTEIVEIDGKYYAKINSLTNSTYSVIWNPITFTDVANHWAKDSVNDMGSRMVEQHPNC